LSTTCEESEELRLKWSERCYDYTKGHIWFSSFYNHGEREKERKKEKKKERKKEDINTELVLEVASTSRVALIMDGGQQRKDHCQQF
jgi:hypothetical protein